MYFFLDLWQIIAADTEEDKAFKSFKAKVEEFIVLSQQKKLSKAEHKQTIKALAIEVYGFCSKRGSSGMQKRLYQFASDDLKGNNRMKTQDVREIFNHLNRNYCHPCAKKGLDPI